MSTISKGLPATTTPADVRCQRKCLEFLEKSSASQFCFNIDNSQVSCCPLHLCVGLGSFASVTVWQLLAYLSASLRVVSENITRLSSSLPLSSGLKVCKRCNRDRFEPEGDTKVVPRAYLDHLGHQDVSLSSSGGPSGPVREKQDIGFLSCCGIWERPTRNVPTMVTLQENQAASAVAGQAFNMHVRFEPCPESC